ncbi:hypothetical protein M9H77_13212 [Catharanthus roseus]|uniref:Uncharacterized protein n=1 Tax=Catharanthus roseus TaxID=4058 RepID=A0ACC0BJS5_CATRO|nr:hypothetical protein M9H77_13212 [Catharanthus roseus]
MNGVRSKAYNKGHKRTGCKGVVARGLASISAGLAGEDGRGLYTVRNAKYQELKANSERLHIKIDSPILTDEQLMFEAVGASNKSPVYGFNSQSTAGITEHHGSSSSSSSVPSVSSIVAHEACIERERRL